MARAGVFPSCKYMSACFERCDGDRDVYGGRSVTDLGLTNGRYRLPRLVGGGVSFPGTFLIKIDLGKAVLKALNIN